MALLYANNAKTLLTADMAASGSSLSIRAADAHLFPDITTVGDWYPLAVTNAAGQVEYMRVVAKAFNVLTVQRGREGSQPIAHAIGEIVDLRLTAAGLDEMTAGLMQQIAAMRQELTAYKTATDERLTAIDARITALDEAQFEKHGGTIKGNVIIDGTLQVNKAATLKDAVSAEKSVGIGGALSVTGKTTLRDLDAQAIAAVSAILSDSLRANLLRTVILEVNGERMEFPVESNPTANGVRLPSGVMIQWGKITNFNGDYSSAAYTRPFVNLPAIVFTPVRSASGNPDKFKVVVDTENVAYFGAETRGFGPSSVNWHAIGYWK